MYDYDLFVRSLVLALKLSEVGQLVEDVCYYPILHRLDIYFTGSRNASITIKADGVLSGLDLMQIVSEVIRTETGGSKK